MDIKLIAVDMDGTLLGEDHDLVSLRNITALRAASEQGIKIVIATGRNETLVEKTAAALGVVDYALTSNGGRLTDWKTGERLLQLPLPDDRWPTALDILHRHGLSVELYADGEAYVTEADLEGVEKLPFPQAFRDTYMKRVRVVSDVPAAVEGKSVEKLDIFYVPAEERDAVVAELKAVLDGCFSGSLSTNMEITHPDANKGKTLAFLCDRLGIGPEEVMAFGDGDNDLEMLAWAGRSYAMRNASEDAKQAAKFAAPANVDDGVAQVIEKEILDRESSL